jgi:heptosyltransferase-2
MLERRWSCKILLLIGPGEEKLGERITQFSRVNIINTGADRVDLATLKPIVKRCRLLITNDTGPRHYAVALGVPAVVMMGPTDPRYTQANLSNTIVLRRDLECAPCHEKRCPRNHECMTAITPQVVMDAAATLYRTN